jgi:predicted nucleotidyltransferase
MGALKIARKLEKQGILLSKQLGKAKFYTINFKKDYVAHYLKFVLKREIEQAQPYVKVWANEIKKIKSADSAILFGSVLKKEKEANDIDVLFITDKKKFLKLKEEVKQINQINTKKLHPIYQTKEDFIENIKKENKVVLDALKGLIILGEDLVIEILKK